MKIYQNSPCNFKPSFGSLSPNQILPYQISPYQSSPYQSSSDKNKTNPIMIPNPNQIKINTALTSYTLAAVAKGYREIATLDVPYLDAKGKMYQLNNGQRVVIVPKVGPTTLKTFVKVGSFNEPDEVRGISHFIEHSVFNGSENLAPGEFVKRVEGRGAKYNAGTGFSSTNYYIESPLHQKDDFSEFVKMQADMIKHPLFTPAMIEKEKGPVISEIHMYEDDPNDKAYNLSLKQLFNINSDYQGLIAGSESRIQKLDQKQVFDYYHKWYTPNNMVTVISGNVSPDYAIKTVSKYFGDKPSDIKPNSANKEPQYCQSLSNPIKQAKRQDITSANTNSTLLNMTLIGPKNDNLKDTFAVTALCEALSGHETSRLKQALKPLNTGACSELSVISSNYKDPQVLQLNTNFKPGEEEKGINIVKSTMEEMATKPLSPEELAITKSKLKENLSDASEYSMSITDMLGEALIDHNNIKFYTDEKKMIDNLTAEDIQNAAKKYLDHNKSSMVIVHPQDKDSNSTSAPQPPLRVKSSFKGNSLKHSPLPEKPSFCGKVNSTNNHNNILGDIKEYYLDNNVDLAINNNNTSSKTSASFQLKTDNIPNSKPGVVPILAYMLNKAANDYSDELVKNNKPDINADVGVGYNNISMGITYQPEKMPSSDSMKIGLGMIRDILYKSDLNEENFNKAKEEVKFQYSSLPKSPFDKATEKLYGDSPLGYSDKKIAENIDKVTFDDVKSLKAEITNNSQGKAVITCPLSKDPGLEKTIIKSLSKNEIPTVKKPCYTNTFSTPPLTENSVIVETEDRQQAHAIQMYKTKETGNIKDEAATDVANEELGGNSDSKLFRILREKQNLAYQVRSRYTANDKTGQLTLEIKTTTKNTTDNKNNPNADNLKKSLDGFNKQVDDLINKPISEEELKGAKLCVKSKIMNEAESSAGKTALIMNGFNTPYGTQHTEQLLDAIDNLTSQDIQKAAKLRLDEPSVISIIADKDTLSRSKGYLNSRGKLETN